MSFPYTIPESPTHSFSSRFNLRHLPSVLKGNKESAMSSRSNSASVVEPHPSVAKAGAYLSGGRGGAGNYKCHKAEDLTASPTAASPSSRINIPKPFQRPNASVTGRGGAGNLHKAREDEECVFQFDEEMTKRRDLQAPVYHIGRGGAANCIDERADSQRSQPRTTRQDSSASSHGSADSEDSTASNQVRGALSKFTRRFVERTPSRVHDETICI